MQGRTLKTALALFSLGACANQNDGASTASDAMGAGASLVQQRAATAHDATSLALTLKKAPADGDALVLALAVDGPDDRPSSVDGGGVSWQLVATSCQHECSSVWAGFGAASGDSTIRVAWPRAQAGIAASVSEWRGVIAARASSRSDGIGAEADAPSVAASAGDLLFASAGTHAVAPGAPSNGFQPLRTASIEAGDVQVLAAYATASGAAGTRWSLSVGEGWDALTVAFATRGATPPGDAGAPDAPDDAPDATPDGGATDAGGTSSGRNLYVAKNGANAPGCGTASAPCATIGYVDATLAAPGDTVHVAPGVYAGDIVTKANGTASARIRYVSDTPWAATIRGGSTDTGFWSKGDYTDVVGFEVDGSQAPWRMGIYASGSYSTIQHNRVHAILSDPSAFAAAAASHSGGAAIECDNWYGSVRCDTLANLVYDVGPASVARSSLVHGIYHIASGTVANNVVHDVVGLGITLWHDAHDIVIVGNTVSGARDGGIFVGVGDSGIRGGALSSRAGDYVTVNDNIVCASNGGIYEGGITGVHNTYANNLGWQNTGFDVSLQHGLVATNTIHQDPLFVNAAAFDFHLQAGSPAIDSGTPADAPAADFDGVARPQGAGFDRGAFERH